LFASFLAPLYDSRLVHIVESFTLARLFLSLFLSALRGGGQSGRVYPCAGVERERESSLVSTGAEWTSNPNVVPSVVVDDAFVSIARRAASRRRPGTFRLTAICRLFICSLKPTQLLSRPDTYPLPSPPPPPPQLPAQSKVIFPPAAMMTSIDHSNMEVRSQFSIQSFVQAPFDTFSPFRYM